MILISLRITIRIEQLLIRSNGSRKNSIRDNFHASMIKSNKNSLSIRFKNDLYKSIFMHLVENKTKIKSQHGKYN